MNSTSRALLADAAVFFGAALFNFGLEVPLGFATLRFADPIWQAGTGEAVIGAVLLAAGLTGRRRLAWTGWVLSVLGIVFGLSSDRVQGAARDLHVVMIALAVLVLGLLVGAGLLMVLAAASFAVASIVHFGVDLPLGFTTLSDSFPGAAPPEGVIAVVVAAGAAALWARRSWSRGVALGTTTFAVLGTVLGLSITLGSGRTGDIAYHVSVLATLLIILGLLARTGRRTRPAELDPALPA